MRKFLQGGVHIDGRYIPYQIVTACDYLKAKHHLLTEEQLEKYQEDYYKQYCLLTQIIALKQSCYLLRNVSHSCQSLSDGLYDLKNRLIREFNEISNYLFDDEFVENYRW